MPGEPSLALAAFGKHPGWDDHLDDVGMDTPWLVALKRKLYFDGVAANIDAGTWEKMREDQRMENFAHEFLWRANGTLTLGRLWSSRDGKGRGRYPMILCVQTSRVPLVWLLEKAHGQLRELEEHCRTVTTADEVTGQLNLVRGRLRRTLEIASREGEDYSAWFQNPALRLAALDQDPAMGPGHTGLERLLYKLERECPGWLASGASGPTATALHLRVPAAAPSAPASFALWTGFLLRALRPEVPWLLLRHAATGWTDILAGAPATAHFACLRTNENAVPPATAVPYQMDSAFVARTGEWINRQVNDPSPVPPALVETGLAAGDLVPAIGAKKGLWSGLKSLWGES
jgi:hypothetical protein